MKSRYPILPLINRRGKEHTALNAQEEEEWAKATKIHNRALALRKEMPRLSLAAAYVMANREIEGGSRSGAEPT
jgi:hypothetical protein